MSDFGFDAYALGDLDPSEDSHPLEIARDLIATGKPRSALEVLADHQKRLADDPGYLILCGEAWHAAGDAPRAQHAFLGAIRVAPEDPRPLQLLGDLLVERGEQARAKRVFEKAERLELAVDDDTEPLEDAHRATPDDLIAAAERDERTRRTSFNPRQLLLVVAVLLGIGLLMSGVALFVEPSTSTNGPAQEQAPPNTSEVAAATPEVEVVPQARVLVPSEGASTEVVSDTAASSPEVLSAPEPVIEVAAPIVERSKPAPRATRRAAKKPKPSPKVVTKAPPPPAPSESDFDAELAGTTDVAALTRRADMLDARGQLGPAAKSYRRALEIDPDYAPALVGMGRSLLRAEKYAELMSNATRALQLARGVDSRPGLEAEALYQIGRVHHQRREEDAARRLLRQSTSLPKAPADAWFYLGESLSRDNSPAARDAYEQYLKRKPNGHLSDRAQRAIQ